jgi:tetratricopeptide (TPR) repeat protein
VTSGPASTRTLRARSIEDKVASLAPDAGDVRSELWTLVAVADASLETAMFSARRIVELVIGRVLQTEQIAPDRELMKNIEALGARDGKDAQRRRRGDALPPPILPPPLYSALHGLRIYGNLVAHPWEPDKTEQKHVHVTPTDLQVALAQILRLIEWFFQEYPRGPRVDPLYVGGSASLLASYGDAPPTASTLFGRDDDVGLLLRSLTLPGPRVLTVLGPGGTGKTALAARVADEHLRRADGPVILAWFDLAAETSFAALSARLLASLEPGARPTDVSITALAPAARVAQIVRRCAVQPVLLVFDNVETWLDAQLRSATDPDFGRLLGDLASRAPATRVLCTSRVAADAPPASTRGSTQEHFLKPLDGDAFARLLRAEGLVGTDDELRDLGRRLGGNPRLGRLVAETLLRRRLPRVSDALKRASALVTGAADAVISEAFRDLSEPAMRTLETIAIADGPIARFVVVRASALEPEAEESIEAALWEELAPRALVAASPEGDLLWTEHPLIADAVRSRCADRAAVHRRLADALLVEMEADREMAVELGLRRARHLRAAGDADAAARQLTEKSMREWMLKTGAFARMFEEARPLLEGREALPALVRFDLLRLVADSARGRTGIDGMALLEEASKLGAGDAKRCFGVDLQIAHLARLTQRWDDALAALARARVAAEAAQNDLWMAQVLCADSAVAHSMGRGADAGRRAASAIKVADAVGDALTRMEARMRLATSSTGGGNLSRARTLYEEAREIARELGERHAEARLMQSLADIARRQTRQDAATELCAGALEVARATGDRGLEQMTRHCLALTMASRGDAHVPAAIEELRIALRIAFDLGQRRPVAKLVASMSLLFGDLARREPSALAKAFALHRTAVPLFEALGFRPWKKGTRNLEKLRASVLGPAAVAEAEAEAARRKGELVVEATGIAAAELHQ